MTLHDKLVDIGIGSVITGIVLGGWILFHPSPKPVVTIPLPNTTVVTTPGPITEKIIKEYIKDPADAKLIESLFKENLRLHFQVGTLTSTVAQLNSKGGVGVNGGTITSLPSTTMVVNDENLLVNALKSKEYVFKDDQLTAHYTFTPSFTYELHQKFNVATSTGIGKDGSKLSIVKLYQTTPSGQIEVSSVTTEIQTLDNPTTWWFSPRIQGGVRLSSDNSQVFLVAAQLIKRGTSRAAEDTTFAILSPGLTIGNGVKLTLLPVSVNLGRLPHQPFTNLWVSPTLDLNKNVGIAVTATF